MSPVTVSSAANPLTTDGDLIAGGAGGAWERLAKGSDNQVLKVIGGELAWGADATGGGGAAGDYTLASGTSVGAATFTLDKAAPVSLTANESYIALDVFTANCEIRRVTGLDAGRTIMTPDRVLEKAHSSGSLLYFFQTGFIPVAWFGAVGDGTTDDEPSLQWAMRQCAKNPIFLTIEGQNKIYGVGKPLLALNGQKIGNLNPKALAGFAPADTTNAVLMNMTGEILAATFDAATNIVTTAVAHGLSSDGRGVMFKDVTGGGGIVAGRVYYVYNRTTTTFQLSASRNAADRDAAGGAIIDITSNGSATCYCKIREMGKITVDDVLVDGNSVTGLNGIDMMLQQPTAWRKARVNNVDGVGLRIMGQHAVFENYITYNARRALVLGDVKALDDESSMMYFDVFNVEQGGGMTTKCVTSEGTGGFGLHIVNAHVELYGTATDRGFLHVTGGAQHFVFDHVTAGFNVVGQKLVHIENTNAEQTSYTIRDWHTVGVASGTSGITLIQDDARGVTLDSWDDCRNSLNEFVAPREDGAADVDPQASQVVGINGRYHRWGSINDGTPTQAFRPDTTQTAHQSVWRNSADADRFAVGKTGHAMVMASSAPADSDLAAGQMAFWFDGTSGAAKLMVKAKDAGGTVRTGQVTLT